MPDVKQYTYSDGSPAFDANGKLLPPPAAARTDPSRQFENPVSFSASVTPRDPFAACYVDCIDPYADWRSLGLPDPNIYPEPTPMPDELENIDDAEFYAAQLEAQQNEQDYQSLFGVNDFSEFVEPDPGQPVFDNDYAALFGEATFDDASLGDSDPFAGLSNIEHNGDGTYTNLDTGLIFDSAGNVVGGDTEQDAAAALGFTANGDGTYTNEHTGNITDADGNVIFTLNASGTYDNVGTGKTEDFYNVMAKNDSPGVSWWDSLFGTMGSVAGGAGKVLGGVSPGSTSSKSSNPSTGAAPKKTIVSDKRVGNDRVVTYSDGSVQRLSNYYSPAVGTTTAKPPATVSSLLDSIFGLGAKFLGAVPATPNGTAQVQSAAQAAAIQAAQAKQITSNAQLSAAQKTAVPLTAAQKAAAAKSSASNPLPLIIAAAIAAKFLIFT